MTQIANFSHISCTCIAYKLKTKSKVEVPGDFKLTKALVILTTLFSDCKWNYVLSLRLT